MNYSEFTRRFLLIFFVAAVVLPISSTLLFLSAFFSSCFSSPNLTEIFNIFGVVCSAFWSVSLVGIVLILAFDRLAKDDEED